MKVQTFGKVFDARAVTRTEAAKLTLRSELLSAETRICTWDIPQEEAAARFGITGPPAQ